MDMIKITDNYTIKKKAYYFIFSIFLIINLTFLMDVFLLFRENGAFTFNISNEKLHDFLSHYIRFIQNTIFFYSFIYLIYRKLKIKDILYITPFAYFEVNYSIFSQYIHSFILHSGFYNLLTDNAYNISPEYPRLIFFIFILVLYIFLLIKRRFFKPIFLFLSMFAIFMTSFLFHTITLNQLDYFTEKQKILVKKLINDQEKYLAINKCEFLELTCFVYENSSTDNAFNNIEEDKGKDIDETSYKLIMNFKPHIETYFTQSELYFYYTIANDNSINDRILSRKPIAFIKNNNLSIFVVDLNNYTQYLYFNQLIFEILSFFSHIVWSLGILYLIYFHEKRIKNRKKQNIMI